MLRAYIIISQLQPNPLTWTKMFFVIPYLTGYILQNAMVVGGRGCWCSEKKLM